jgi:hypothetical protein
LWFTDKFIQLNQKILKLLNPKAKIHLNKKAHTIKDTNQPSHKRAYTNTTTNIVKKQTHTTKKGHLTT